MNVGLPNTLLVIRQDSAFLADASQQKMASNEIQNSNNLVISELNKKLQQYTFEGRLDAETAAAVGDQLEALFTLPAFIVWFDPRFQSFAEQGILLPGGYQKRPDRILIGAKEAIVVDFKTGEKYASHLAQVKEYMVLVGSLCRKPVKGFLCYLEPTEILEV